LDVANQYPRKACISACFRAATLGDQLADSIKVLVACEYASKFADQDFRIRFCLDHKYTRRIVGLASVVEWSNLQGYADMMKQAHADTKQVARIAEPKVV
jgi:hypothetical protein